jgi:multicomponent Na+:H+ antiporter subunit G
MSSLIIDIIIWILLVTGAGFGLISLIGLLLFPDTRSRMYTAVRASLICISVTGLAVIAYGLNALQTTGQNQYFTLILNTILLVLVLAIGNYLVSSTLLKKDPSVICNPEEKKKQQNGRNKK